LLREYRIRRGKANLKNFVFYFALLSSFTIFADGTGSGGATADLQKAAKRNAKGHELHAKKPPFRGQKVTFCKEVDN